MRTQQCLRRAPVAAITLIEFLVSLALVGVVITAAGTMLLQAYAGEATYRQQNAAQQNARSAIDAISDDLRCATETTAVSVGSYTYASPLTFRLYPDAYSNDPTTERKVYYWRDSTTLRRKVDAASSTGPANASDGTAIATGISTDPTVTLTVVDPDYYATVSVTATSGTGATMSTVQLTTKVGLRNYILPY